MSQSINSVRAHCPVRPNVPFDAPLGPASYGRMFPELPSFEADEQFLHALGRMGGACDGGDFVDSPDSLADTAAGWPIFGQFVAHDITADRSLLRSRANAAELHKLAARNSTLNVFTVTGRPVIRSSISATIRRSSCLDRTE